MTRIREQSQPVACAEDAVTIQSASGRKQLPDRWSEPPVLLVCATGGHLAQLHRLVPRLDIVGPNRVWVTFDTPQSRSLLADEHVIFVRYTGPRDLANTLRNSRVAIRLLRSMHFRAVVSTGSAIAMSFLPLATMLGIPTYYIESAARHDGPSLTGRMLEHVPKLSCYTQYRCWEGGRWRYVGSVFDEFEPIPKDDRRSSPRRIVVTLGTIQGYGFPRLVRRIKEIVPEEIDVVWQLGDTRPDGLGIDGTRAMPAREFASHIGRADVVIAHAGIGSALEALDAGRLPVLVPRRFERGEHVDDHQVQIASELAELGLALHREAEELSFEDLKRAWKVRVRHEQSKPILTSAA